MPIECLNTIFNFKLSFLWGTLLDLGPILEKKIPKKLIMFGL